MIVEVVKKIYVFYGNRSSAPCSGEPIAGLYIVPHECNLDPFPKEALQLYPAINSPSTIIRLKWDLPEKLPCGFDMVFRPAKRPVR